MIFQNVGVGWRLIGSYTSPYWRSEISSTSVRNSVFSRVECSGTSGKTVNSLTSGRNPRSSIRTSASTCFFRFNLQTKHVDFIHSFACKCHVYYIKYYNATCNAVNTHLFIVTVCVFVLSILFLYPQRTHYFWRVFGFLFMEHKQDYSVTSVKDVKVCF